MTTSLPEDLESYVKELIRLGIRRFPSEIRKCRLMQIVVTKGHCVDIEVPEVLHAKYRENYSREASKEVENWLDAQMKDNTQSL